MIKKRTLKTTQKRKITLKKTKKVNSLPKVLKKSTQNIYFLKYFFE